ncbi:MAG: DnaJ domain-containing protein [Pseudomonadota bacterium]
MITILSIIVPVIIFVVVLWTVAVIQKHWFGTERNKAEQTGSSEPAARRAMPRVCEKCGAEGPDMVFINRLCLKCYASRNSDEQSTDRDREWDGISGETAQYYRILGCTEQDSDQDVKRQYHMKAKEMHPDSFLGRDLPEDRIKFHTAEFQKLQEAYAKILEHRARRG